MHKAIARIVLLIYASSFYTSFSYACYKALDYKLLLSLHGEACTYVDNVFCIDSGEWFGNANKDIDMKRGNADDSTFLFDTCHRSKLCKARCNKLYTRLLHTEERLHQHILFYRRRLYVYLRYNRRKSSLFLLRKCTKHNVTSLLLRY